jgi:ribonuclease D
MLKRKGSSPQIRPRRILPFNKASSNPTSSKPPALHTTIFAAKTHRIHTCYTVAASQTALKTLRYDPLIGLDIEWTITYKKGESQRKTALIQLCGAKDIVLIHCVGMKQLPELLVDILRDGSIVKSGVAARGDVLKIFRDFDVKACGIMDIGQVHKDVFGERESSYTLASMIQRVFNMGMAKDQGIRTGT